MYEGRRAHALSVLTLSPIFPFLALVVWLANVALGLRRTELFFFRPAYHTIHRMESNA